MPVDWKCTLQSSEADVDGSVGASAGGGLSESLHICALTLAGETTITANAARRGANVASEETRLNVTARPVQRWHVTANEGPDRVRRRLSGPHRITPPDAPARDHG